MGDVIYLLVPVSALLAWYYTATHTENTVLVVLSLPVTAFFVSWVVIPWLLGF